ncbi:Mitochondrial pyruvate carrier subunit [Hanseniaspora osmophila]
MSFTRATINAGKKTQWSSKFNSFINSEAGPKTIHFWAPTLKWGLVFAGISDLQRPVDKISGAQNLSLLATAMIWTRWSFVIKPKNMLLASVNFFLGCTAGYQLGRIVDYRLKEGDSKSQVLDYIINGGKETGVKAPEQEANVNKPLIHHPLNDNNDVVIGDARTN